MPDLRSLLPLDDHQVRRLDELRKLDPLAGWGQELGDDGVFVDAGGVRYYGAAFHQAIGRAIRDQERRAAGRAA